jgi:hypothetical protein
MGSLPEKRSKVNRREFMHHLGADSQTAVRPLVDGQTARPGWSEALVPVLGIHRRVRVTVIKLLASTHFLVTPLGTISG